MRRRRFLSLFGLGAGLAAFGVPGSARAAASASQVQGVGVPRMPLFIGMGGGGINILNALPEALDEPYRLKPRISHVLHRPDETQKLARELSEEQIKQMLGSATLPFREDAISRVVLLAGLAGATGGEMVSVVARKYRDIGIEVSAVVTLPFSFEGQRRMRIAERQLLVLRETGCQVAVIRNDEVIAGLHSKMSMLEAFRAASQAVGEAAAAAAWPEIS